MQYFGTERNLNVNHILFLQGKDQITRGWQGFHGPYWCTIKLPIASMSSNGTSKFDLKSLTNKSKKNWMYLAANSTFFSAPLFVNQKFSLYVWEHKLWMFYSGGEEQWSVIFSLLMCVIFFLHKSISTKCFYPNNILVLVSINISHETIYNTVNDIKVSHEFRHVNSMSSGVQNLHLVFLWSVPYYQQMHQIVMEALSFKCSE